MLDAPHSWSSTAEHIYNPCRVARLTACTTQLDNKNTPSSYIIYQQQNMTNSSSVLPDHAVLSLPGSSCICNLITFLSDVSEIVFPQSGDPNLLYQRQGFPHK